MDLMERFETRLPRHEMLSGYTKENVAAKTMRTSEHCLLPCLGASTTS